ncbi:hypothetical protein IC229_05755 [Spirosoma sp. BT702]|uniref:Uncharacterized protein n=1 Tax=Spirosoma profusum TaxID=2771354 RepID=A0A926Y1B1_9BACT|nr:hypothetical protein [Spirosoma profusum]MBD2700130.1 hypothetical protein [Spirosoma profusum]
MLFSNPVLFELPALPRVAKFIRTKLRDPTTGTPQPMLLDPQATGPGLFLWAMCQNHKEALFACWAERPGSKSRGKSQRIYYPEKVYTDRIGVGISEFHYTRHQYLLNYIELGVWHNWVEFMMQNELVQFCEQARDTPPMSRIKTWCDRYDFSEDDFSEAALKQMYLRYRKQIGANGFAPEVSSTFQFIPIPLAA